MPKKKSTQYHYGNVGVDSGQLLIIDPCYLEQFMELYSLDDIFKAEGEMKYKAGHGGIACKLQSFGGDGYFPVYAWKGYKNKYSPPNTAFTVMLYE